MWCNHCDESLHRRTCKVWGYKDERMAGWIGDPPEDLSIHSFFDAVFAGCLFTVRSTSGLHLDLQVPNSRFHYRHATTAIPSLHTERHRLKSSVQTSQCRQRESQHCASGRSCLSDSRMTNVVLPQMAKQTTVQRQAQTKGNRGC